MEQTAPTKEFPTGYHGKKAAGWGVPTRSEVTRETKRLRVFLEFVEALPQGARLLDVGCGSGKAVRRVLALRPDVSVYGIDSGDLSEYLPKEVKFIQGSAEELTKHYEKDFFDAIVCQHLIEHLLYPMDLMSGIYAVLKPGGRVYLETPNWTRVYAPFSEVWFWNDYTHLRPYSKHTLHRLYNETGFHIDLLASCSSHRWFPSRSQGGGEEGSSALSQPTLLQGVYRRGFLARVCNRLINPLLRDILIGIATKPAAKA